MKRMLFMFLACLTLAGCGLGETAVSAAAGAGSQAEQAQEALTQAPSATAQISDLWHQVSQQSMKDAAFIPLVQAGVPIFKSSNVMNPVYLPINEAYDVTNLWLSNA